MLWLRCPRPGSGTDDSTSSGNELCVDSGLASFGTFCGARHSSCVGSLRSGSPSSLSPDAARPSPPPDSLTTDHCLLTTVSCSPSLQPPGATRRSPLPPDSLATVGVRREAWSVERGVSSPSLWLRFRPGGSGTDDSTSSGDELCVDSGLASYCTFSGVFTLEGGLCRSQAPRYGRSVASSPSWDKIPILSIVESSMKRSESRHTIRPRQTYGVV